MRVFFSYGHDRNAPLVERIRCDLDMAGHETWIDTSEIKAGEDWRHRIVDGLKRSDWVLAFLSKHSTRDPGVCLDEMAIALHEKAGAISTVLVEPSKDVGAPVTLRHVQHLDMHDWEARQEAGPAAFEAWYRGKLDEILRLLASPGAVQFGGEIEELSRRLHPIAQEADIGPLVDGFVGRDWLLHKLEAWRLGESGSRLFWITGAPGSGKSAFAAWAAHFGRANVITLNLCRYNIDDRRDPARVLRTFAFQLATRLQDYRRLLLDRLRLQDPDGVEMARKSPADLLDWLLIQPLGSGIDGGRSHDRLVVVIDALDETVRDGRSVLAEVLAEAAPRLPKWLALLVTSRPDSPIARQFAGIRPQPIAAASEENKADLEIYARGWLAGSGQSAEQVERLVARIAEAANGNFLYLRKLQEGAEAGLLDLAAPEGLPRGLVGLYERWFRHQFPNAAAYEREMLPLLEVIVAAEHPVPEAVLTGLFGWSVRERARQLDRLGSLFERRPEGVAPFHKSLRDWLVDERAAGADYVADPAAGRNRLRAFLWQRFLGEVRAGETAAPDAFTLAELPHLLAGDEGRDDAAGLAASAEWGPVLDRMNTVARTLAARFAWVRAQAWWDMAARLSIGVGDPGLPYLGVIRNEQGDIERTLGHSFGALAAYRDGMAIAERLARQDPGNAQWQRDLFVSHIKIGDVLRARGDGDGALAAFQDGMAIAERLARQDPGNTQWQRDLSISHERIGDVLRAQGDGDGALAAFQDGMAIAERLARQDPGNTQWQRDLSISHNRIGDVLRARGDGDGALAAFQDGMAIAERLARQDPGNTQWQRDLSISHERIGDVLRAQGDGDGALAAFRDGMAIAERLARQDPGNAQWQRDLSISHNRIGDVLRAQGDGDGALAAFRDGIAIRERLARQDPGNAEWQRDLSVNHNKVGDVLQAQGDGDGALAAYRDGMAIAERLARQDPGNAQWQRDLSVNHERIGDVLRAQGDGDGALAAYRDGMAIAERLARQDPGNAQWQRDLFVSHIKIGDVLRARGDGDGALAAFRDGMAIAERLARQDPGNAQWQRDLFVGHIKIGDVLQAQGDGDGALAAFQDGMAIRERLARQDPGNTQWQRDLFVSHIKIGDVLRARGDGDGALAAFQDGMAIAERLARQDPGNTQWQRDLSISHERIGDVLRAQGDGDGALAAFRDGMAIAERLARQDPGNAEWQRDLFVSHRKIGDVLQAQGDGDGALAAFQDGMAIAERLARQDPGNAQWQRDLSVSHNRIGDVLQAQGDGDSALAAFREGMAITERLARQDPGNAGWQFDLIVSHYKLAEVLLSAGDLAAGGHAQRARNQARLWAERFPQDPRRAAVLNAIEDLLRRIGDAERPNPSA